MKKIIALALIMVCALLLSACKQEEEAALRGINVEVVGLDTDNQIVYVADYGEDTFLGARCAIDCKRLIADQEIFYVNFDTDEVSPIRLSDLLVGDKLIINAYESQIN